MPGESENGARNADDTATLDADVRKEFLVEVVLLNAGILALGVGTMILFFDVSIEGGIALLLIGVVSVTATIWRYRNNAPGS
ncbi:MAG: DUF7322 domain-containing protein [Halodesulfurarchaeum sp.]